MTNYDDALDQLVNTLQKHQSILEFKDIEKKDKGKSSLQAASLPDEKEPAKCLSF
ncbi:hypothetical protein QYR55_09950 [Streptococcus iniae]|uniref:hypothetical protein n=1 Tax=Streptococcus iniae TaxID=1346 RepID=UPI002B2A288F|nr:hypothetical protein QYR55_09950 [Streptococcus iniae]WNZ91561.1 hypothetical protein QYR59_09955 [Streptococcus iniae]